MRIPLIVSARPSTETRFPVAVLRRGKWIIESDHTDSKVIVSNPTFSVEPSQEFILSESTQVSVSFLFTGTESSVTVYAKWLSH